MQQTFDPGEKGGGSLGEHHAFAKKATDGEIYKHSDLQYLADEVLPGIFLHTKHFRMQRKIWVAELLFLVVLEIIFVMELVGHCKFIGAFTAPRCERCYSDMFLFVAFGTGVLWLLHLYLFILLKSKGFYITRQVLKQGVYATYEGVFTDMALNTYFGFSFGLATMWFAGAFAAFESHIVCVGAGAGYERPRSQLLVYINTATLCFLPLCMLFRM
ncbi:unnamed protein product [Amoebophrya sp. A25]|nr:unnamed protein product [Amoebophrya sp. A25]|eukprot:GSA25T00004465001.1